MNFSRSSILAAITILSLAAARAADEIDRVPPAKPVVDSPTPITFATPEASENALLQGKWEGVEIGQEAQGRCTLTVDGHTIHFEGAKKGEWYKATFVLDPKTDPKQMKGTISDCPRPEMLTLVSTAIYKLDRGKLTLASHRPGTDEIPKNFELAPGVRIFEFKKATDTK